MGDSWTEADEQESIDALDDALRLIQIGDSLE